MSDQAPPAPDFEQAPDIAVSIEAGPWLEIMPEAVDLCRDVALAALAMALDGGPHEHEPLEVSIALADDSLVRELNRTYRSQDKATNVLSFAALDDEDSPQPEDGPLLLGDVVIAFETTQAEAERGSRRNGSAGNRHSSRSGGS